MTTAAHTITITEKTRAGSGFLASVTIDGQPKSYDVTVRDPADEAQRRLIAEYFGMFQEEPALWRRQRSDAEDALSAYGESLFTQVFDEQKLRRRYEEARESGYDGWALRISGGGEFHRLHWELLRDPRDDEPLPVRMPLERHTQHDTEWKTPPPGPSLNILVVTARPFGAVHGDHRTISRTLVDIAWTAGSPIRVSLARPGTWRALERHLDETTQEKGPGWYQAIHFDLDGEMLSDAALRDRIDDGHLARTGRPLPPFEGEQAFLYFETATDGVADPVSVTEVARLLERNRLTVAMLNACRSAREPESGGGLAQRLAAAGAPVVVGMAYSAAGAVAHAAPVFYRRLAGGRTPREAVQDARRELFRDRERAVDARRRVDVQDWMLPVLFQQQEVAIELTAMSPAEHREFYASQARAAAEPTEVLGRDVDVLAVERRMLDRDSPRMLVVYGEPGIGKTYLLRLITWWWQRTGPVRQAFTFESSVDRPWPSPRAMLERIARELPGDGPASADSTWEQLLGSVTHRLRSEPYLLVLDSGERPLTGPGGFEGADRETLEQLLISLRRGRTLVLIGSRSTEDWLGTVGVARYPLPPRSDPPDAGPWVDDPGKPHRPTTVTAGARRSGRIHKAAGGAVAALVLALAGGYLWSASGDGPPASAPVTASSTRTGAEPRATTRPASTGEASATSEPTWATGPLQASGVEITSPDGRSTIESCVTVAGTATGLAANETIVVAVRRADQWAGYPYFYFRIAGWDDPGPPPGPWSAVVPLGHSAGQTHDIIALVADRETVRSVWRPGNMTSDNAEIPGLRRAAEARIHQDRATGDC